jgi:flagellar hook-associated protein 3 FlgL
MNAKYGTLAKIQEQISTGERLPVPSDDPASTARIMAIDEYLESTQQYQKNADFASARLATEETALTSVMDSLQRVRELVVQSKNGTLGDADRRMIAEEIHQNFAAVVQQANTQDGNGEFIFSGFNTHTPPISQDAAGQVAYRGDQGRRMLQVSAFRQIPDGDSGQDVFLAIRNGNGTFSVSANSANAGTGVISTGAVTDPTAWVPGNYTINFTSATTYDVLDASSALVTSGSFSAGGQISFLGVTTSISGSPQTGDTFTLAPSANQSLFTTLNTIDTALRSPLTTATSRTQFFNTLDHSLADLDQAFDHLSGIKAVIGSRQSAIDGQKRANEDFSIELAKVKSSLADVDIVAASADLARETTALQAAQQAFVRLQSLSLFDFL